MPDQLTYRFTLMVMAGMMLILSIGILGLAVVGKPIPSELTNALTLILGFLGGVFSPQPIRK